MEVNVDNLLRVSDMLETMQEAGGVGLAAQQVGEVLQLTVSDVSQTENRPSRMWINGEEVDPNDHMPLVLLNPELTLSRETEVGPEGCLSFPEVSADITRATRGTMKATDLEGKRLEFEAEGLLARVAQPQTD